MSAGELIEIEVSASLSGLRLDRAISLLSGRSRAQALELLESGAVAVDGKVVAKGSAHLVEGSNLRIQVPPPETGEVEPDESVVVDVALEDDDFLVINKHAGQVVHPGAGQREHTLVAGLLARYPELTELVVTGECPPERPGIVHRLDKGTSGLLVVARSREGFQSLSEQLADRTMGRTYYGLVEGHVAENRGVVDAPIGRSTRVPTMMAVRSDGRPARTGYEVIGRFDKPSVSLMRLRLETGRTHQIRVHMATIGHPVVNDPRYGHRRDKRLEPDRFFLHSHTLTFAHPRSGELVTTVAPLPADLSALVPPDFAV